MILMVEMEALRVKFDTLQFTMKHEKNTALDERGIGCSKFHTNNILNAIADSERRMLSTLEMQPKLTGVSEDYQSLR